MIRAKYRLGTHLLKISASLLALIAVSLLISRLPQNVGSVDFIQYWSGARVFLNGGNPYDWNAIFNEQKLLGATAPTPTFLPPWAFPLILLFSPLTYSVAIGMWFLTNVALLVALAIWTVRTVVQRRETELSPTLRALAVSSVFLFLPSLYVLIFGQISVFIAIGIYGTWWCFRERRDIGCGALLALSSFKPHLSYLFLFALGWQLVRERRWQAPLSALVAIGGLTLIAVSINPQIVRYWLTTKLPLEFLPSSGITPLRFLLARDGILPRWPIVVVPAVMLAATTVLLLRKKLNLNSLPTVVSLLALSLFTSPYGWPFDQVLLVGGQVALVTHSLQAPPRERRVAISLLVLLQLAALLQRHFSVALDDFAWFPFAFLLLFLGLWPRVAGRPQDNGD